MRNAYANINSMRASDGSSITLYAHPWYAVSFYIGDNPNLCRMNVLRHNGYAVTHNTVFVLHHQSYRSVQATAGIPT
jgi:hypothetical protein